MIHQTVDRQAVARGRARLRGLAPSPTDLREAVECFMNAGSVEDAWEPLTRLLEHDPNDAPLRLLAGVVAAELGKVNDAETLFREVIAREPASIAAHHNLALLYFATNRPEHAEQEFCAILAREPANGEALNDLAVLYASLGREQEACRTFDRCLTIAPDYARGRQNGLEFAWETTRYAQGVEWVRCLAARYPDDPDLANWHEKFAQAMRQQGHAQGTSQGKPQLAAGADTSRQVVSDLGKVSVIIPAYNAEHLLVATVASVLAQTHPDIEVIVVDDGSIDDPDRAVQGFGSRVSCVRRVHQGWASAVNEGIQRSQGQYILTLNPGDDLKPEAVADCLRICAADTSLDVLAGEEPHGSDGVPSGWVFRRRAFARTGYFDEVADDDDGFWSRRLMSEKVSHSCNSGRIGPELVFSTASPHRGPTAAVPDEAYRLDVVRRWIGETRNDRPMPSVGEVPKSKTVAKTGLSLVIVGMDDPGGMFSSLALAINEHTPHRCQVVVQKPAGAYDSRVVLQPPPDAAGRDSFVQQVRALARQADRLVFVTGIAPGAARRDRRLGDDDEFRWDILDWREWAEQKPCVAFLCSSPSVRGNYAWYHERFARQGWPVVTAWPDIYLNVPDSHFVPPVIDLSQPEYARVHFSVGPVAIVHRDRPQFAAGGEDLLGPIAARLKRKHGARVLFGRCAEMTLRETLVFRRRAHIGFDRMSPGAPRFGLTSLENSALGLVNIVYLDPFARALLARTLGTDEIPWVSPDSPEALFAALDRLVADPDELQRRMMATAQWFRRWWSPDRIVRCFTNVLENT